MDQAGPCSIFDSTAEVLISQKLGVS